MTDPVLDSKRCPVCHASSILRGQRSKFGTPTFQCGSCGAILKTRLTVRALWALPVAVIMLALTFAIVTWLRASSFLSPTLMAAAIGGLIGLSFAVSNRVAQRALEFAKA